MTSKADNSPTASIPAGMALHDKAIRDSRHHHAWSPRESPSIRPETCVIDPEVEVAAGTIIEPFVQLLGTTRVGTGCRIRSFSVIENCTLGDGVLDPPELRP